MKKYLAYLKKFQHWYNHARPTERNLVNAILLIVIAMLIYTPVSAFNTYVENNERNITRRKYDLERIDSSAQRYTDLQGRFNKIKKTFEESQMTLGELTAELEKIVSTSLSNENYELTRAGAPSKMGLDFEKQQFILKVRSLSLEELVKLLHQLEQGKSPLLLGKVDILKSTSDNEFSATLEIFSISKAS